MYEMLAVPIPVPVTTPAELTEAITVAELLQVPPPVPSDKDAVPERQILTAPDGLIADGSGFTVTVFVA